MKKEEALKVIRAEMSTQEIISEFGITTITKDNQLILDALNTAGITDPVSVIAELKQQISDNEKAVKEAKISAAFGKQGTKEEPNPEREYADKVLVNVSLDKLDDEIQNLATDSVMKTIKKQRADENSALNLLDKSETDAPKVRDC